MVGAVGFEPTWSHLTLQIKSLVPSAGLGDTPTNNSQTRFILKTKRLSWTLRSLRPVHHSIAHFDPAALQDSHNNYHKRDTYIY